MQAHIRVTIIDLRNGFFFRNIRAICSPILNCLIIEGAYSQSLRETGELRTDKSD